MNEKIVESSVSSGVFELPWAVWFFIITGVSSVIYKCVRIFFRVGALEEQNEELKKQNKEQDKKTSKIEDLANDTNKKVSRILGYLDGKKEAKEGNNA